jgi:predicted TIM-barrel fold metal-dependent hydrolase
MICDCHAHLVGPPPHDADWPHQTPEARLEDYLATLDAHGIGRGVLVQPRAAGFDNGLIAAALARHPQRLRGVAVVPADIRAEELERLHAAGFRGVRLGGKVAPAALGALAPRLSAAGLHVQLLLRGPELLDLEEAIGRCPVPVVIDHLAHPDPGAGTGGAAFRCLDRLLAQGHVFAKLSAVFRWAARPDWSDALPVWRAVLDRHAAHLVWGSDWPFLNQPPPGPGYGALLDFLRREAGAERFATITERVPRVLYGF